jgi:hypothetical protein
MALIDARLHFKYVQVIRGDIGPESVEKCGDVEYEPISGKKLTTSP